jgi:hypothetical protein
MVFLEIWILATIMGSWNSGILERWNNGFSKDIALLKIYARVNLGRSIPLTVIAALGLLQALRS